MNSEMPSPPLLVLIVDDETEMCELTADFLARLGGIRGRTVSSVAEARALLEREPFDAIVSDYQMPKEDGVQFLKSLRAAGDKVPFILFTGRGREEVAIEALNSGADGYLQKGGRPDSLYAELAHRVKSAAHKHRVERDIEIRNAELQKANEELSAAKEEMRAQLEEIMAGNNARALAEGRLKASENERGTLFEGMMNGCAVHQIICDNDGEPVDYRFVSLNRAFEDMTGLRRETTVGRTVREIIPNIEDEWIKRYGKVALTGVPDHFQNYVAGLGKHFEVTVYMNEPGQFTTIFNDVTRYIRNDHLIKTRREIGELSLKCGLDDTLRRTLDEAEKLTGSSIGFIHFVGSDQETLHLQMWSTNTISTMCSADGKGQHYPASKAGVWVDCLKARAPVVHNDVAGLPHRKGFPPGHAPVVRELLVPVMRGEKVVAIMGVGNKAADYDAEDIKCVSELADLTWDIAERKRVEDDVSHYKE
jgi:PAS domain S-box-containing protein